MLQHYSLPLGAGQGYRSCRCWSLVGQRPDSSHTSSSPVLHAQQTCCWQCLLRILLLWQNDNPFHSPHHLWQGDWYLNVHQNYKWWVVYFSLYEKHCIFNFENFYPSWMKIQKSRFLFISSLFRKSAIKYENLRGTAAANLSKSDSINLDLNSWRPTLRGPINTIGLFLFGCG